MSANPQQAASGAAPFWSRQFAPDRTGGQLAFDVAFGVVLPAICLYFDPFVVRTTVGGPLQSGYGVAAAGMIAIGMLSLAVWLAVGRPAAFLCGLLAADALFAALLGIALLPLSLLGLFFSPIGLLGFTPFFTSFVFLRNAVGAFRRARRNKFALFAAAAVGMYVAIVVPVATQHYATQQTYRALELVRSSDPATADAGLALFKRMRFVVNSDELVGVYGSTDDPARRQKVADAYRELTGADIEERAEQLWDD